jgi:hypothetical protein
MKHRPEFPNCVMTPNIISRIREEQECYDKDPEKYERNLERQREEREQERLYEEQELRHQFNADL